ncbi:WxL domain-containing protein [Enterococcus plantarum]|uniref:WxL domain-containing protein n=1 Tax=Enterococcus plantarum TaxID=1077675 RepID=UPI001A8CB9FD|nr:WxL domain-containing protein [Enterococcus plantarum]MBO0468692.1 WxL domain-containing protein [Enterococcus plantarum]
MKNFRKVTGLMSIAILGAVMINSTSAFAETKTRKTDAVIKFTPPGDGEGPVDPVDPTDPSIPVTPIDPTDPTKPVDPGTNGPLSLDYASSLSFSEQKITTKDKIYYADMQQLIDPEKGEEPYKSANYVQMTDLRGTLAGWSLSVQQNGQFKTEDGDELKGAQLQFNHGKHATISESAAPSQVQETITLNADGTGSASNVMAAKVNEGGGTHILRFGSDDAETPEESTIAKGVQLSVPGKSEKLLKKYATTLTWTISSIPTNE